jgi:hypothetical protein
MADKKRKKEFKEQQEQLRVLLNEWDILGVMSHAPEDEYDDLQGAILGGLVTNKPIKVLARELAKWIQVEYEMDLGEESCARFLEKVYEWWDARQTM